MNGKLDYGKSPMIYLILLFLPPPNTECDSELCIYRENDPSTRLGTNCMAHGHTHMSFIITTQQNNRYQMRDEGTGIRNAFNTTSIRENQNTVRASFLRE